MPPPPSGAALAPAPRSSTPPGRSAARGPGGAVAARAGRQRGDAGAQPLLLRRVQGRHLRRHVRRGSAPAPRRTCAPARGPASPARTSGPQRTPSSSSAPRTRSATSCSSSAPSPASSPHRRPMPSPRRCSPPRAPAGRCGVDDLRHLDLWTAVITGLTDQQISNDPGGDRWGRLLDEAVDMFRDHAGVPPTAVAPGGDRDHDRRPHRPRCRRIGHAEAHGLAEDGLSTGSPSWSRARRGRLGPADRVRGLDRAGHGPATSSAPCGGRVDPRATSASSVAIRRRVQATGDPMVDVMTALQVERTAGLSTDRARRRAAGRGRRRPPPGGAAPGARARRVPASRCEVGPDRRALDAGLPGRRHPHP